MKKNIFSILALAISIMNLLLSILIVFTLVPSAIKTNNLIGKVASSIDLEIDSIEASDGANKSIPLSDLEVYDMGELTITLKKEQDTSRNHYALVSPSLSIHTKHKDYKKLNPELKSYEAYIIEIITDEFSKYTANNVIENKEEIKEEILSKLTQIFNSDFIVDISISKLIVD